MKLQGIDAHAFLRQCSGDEAGQREIHIVAAQQDVLADGHALERQLALLLGHGYKRKVRRAAADIEDQNQIAELYALAPVLVALDPRVECGLRFLEQRDIAEAGPFGGLQGQLARYSVERRGNRDQHLLLSEGRISHLRVPSAAQVVEIA
jgi:hypothetical protein